MITIGSLYHKRESKGWCSFVELAMMLGTKNYKFVSFGYGVPKNNHFLSAYAYSPNNNVKKSIYRSADIWFSDTVMEGFHNVPAEAAIEGCFIVCNRVISNGMSDYATDETAGLFTSLVEAVRIIKNPDFTSTK